MSKPPQPSPDNESEIDRSEWQTQSTLRVCNNNVEVCTVPQLKDKAGDTLFGCWSMYPKPVICLSLEVASNDMFQFRSSAIHEIFHGISEFLGMDLTEQDVRGLENAFMGFCKDNPEDARFLLFGDGMKKPKAGRAKSKKRKGVLKNTQKI